MTIIKRVVVAGATGSLGLPIVRALTSSGLFQVSILTRSSDKTILNTVSIVTDYSKASLLEAFRGQDAVVSTLGALGIMLQRDLVNAAVKAGIKRFIPSDFAPYTPDLDAMQTIVPQVFARLQPKQDLLGYLKQQSTDHPSFTWSAIGSGPLFEWCLTTGAQGLSISKRSAVITDSGNETFHTTTAAQIARAIVYVMSHPDDTAGKYMLVNSFTITQNELLAHLERVTQEKWQSEHVDSEQRKKDGLNLLAQGNFAGLGNLWSVYLNTDGKGQVGRLEKHIANDTLQLPKEDIDDVIRKLVASLA
ncbi:hypothetical protein CBS101457_006890 [Exobasidium rhododendri]|nr:hypothetical protein CBS101457_006890 [Exobasidium rhododendri]